MKFQLKMERKMNFKKLDRNIYLEIGNIIKLKIGTEGPQRK